MVDQKFNFAPKFSQTGNLWPQILYFWKKIPRHAEIWGEIFPLPLFTTPLGIHVQQKVQNLRHNCCKIINNYKVSRKKFNTVQCDSNMLHPCNALLCYGAIEIVSVNNNNIINISYNKEKCEGWNS